jgi:hypothetical protein
MYTGIKDCTSSTASELFGVSGQLFGASSLGRNVHSSNTHDRRISASNTTLRSIAKAVTVAASHPLEASHWVPIVYIGTFDLPPSHQAAGQSTGRPVQLVPARISSCEKSPVA